MADAGFKFPFNFPHASRGKEKRRAENIIYRFVS